MRYNRWSNYDAFVTISVGDLLYEEHVVRQQRSRDIAQYFRFRRCQLNVASGAAMRHPVAKY